MWYYIILLLWIEKICCFSINQANISVWLSAAAYCDKTKYQTMSISGPATGFIVKNIIHDYNTDIQGYVGFLQSAKTIYAVFRGSSSIRNWINDFEVKKVDYLTFPDCGCKVHKGFYKSTVGILNETVSAIDKLKKEYDYDIIITGHSYGAAVAQLFAMELASLNIESSVYNFGQPRIGDYDYSVFVNSKLTNMWRIVHNADIVPHIPTIKGFEYYHSCREVFEDEFENIRICSASDCEDIMCSQKYKLQNASITDHDIYLGHYMSCENSIAK